MTSEVNRFFFVHPSKEKIDDIIKSQEKVYMYIPIDKYLEWYSTKGENVQFKSQLIGRIISNAAQEVEVSVQPEDYGDHSNNGAVRLYRERRDLSSSYSGTFSVSDLEIVAIGNYDIGRETCKKEFSTKVKAAITSTLEHIMNVNTHATNIAQTISDYCDVDFDFQDVNSEKNMSSSSSATLPNASLEVVAPRTSKCPKASQLLILGSAVAAIATALLFRI